MAADMTDRLRRSVDQEPEVRMTFGEHIEELRRRLLKSIVFLCLALLVCVFFYEELVAFITEPHFRAMKLLGKSVEESKFLSSTYTGPVVAMMKLAFIVALFVSSPWIGYQIWAFVSAGLYRHERRYVLTFAPISFALFCVGCVFGYTVLIPYSLYGLAKVLNLNIVSPTYSFSEYLDLVMKLTILLGGIFQLPLVMVFLSKVGLVPPSAYNKWRRAAIIANVVFAAIITPADVLTMILVAAPLLLLYEIGVVTSFLLARPAKKPS
jgi:Tat protein translocase TatC